MTHPVVSATVINIERRGMRPGRRVAAPPTRTPGRPFHAVTDKDDAVTVCGVDASGMHRFGDMVWETVNKYGACPDCRAALDS